MRPSHRFFSVLLAFAAPFLAFACELTPADTPGGTSSSSASSSSGSGGTSSSGGSGGTSSSTGSTTTSSSSTTSSSTSSGTGGTMGTGGTGGATASSSGSGGGMPDAGDASAPVVCNTTVTKYAVDPSPHIAACFPVQYASNPPTSGPHYPTWAAFKTYTTPVPRGFYVHSLEHGAVVITYNCPGGCDAELAQLQAYLDARPADPLCTAPLKSRVIVTPDPLLDVRFAASAWGWALRSNCFDLQWLGLFIDAHYAQAPENFCIDGTDVTVPDAGFPANCGEADAGP